MSSTTWEGVHQRLIGYFAHSKTLLLLYDILVHATAVPRQFARVKDLLHRFQ